jgi:hypothetical protein
MKLKRNKTQMSPSLTCIYGKAGAFNNVKAFYLGMDLWDIVIECIFSYMSLTGDNRYQFLQRFYTETNKNSLFSHKLRVFSKLEFIEKFAHFVP